MKIYKKILLIFFFALLLLFLNNNVFAATYESTLGELSCPDELLQSIDKNVNEINDDNYKIIFQYINHSSYGTVAWVVNISSNPNFKIYCSSTGTLYGNYKSVGKIGAYQYKFNNYTYELKSKGSYNPNVDFLAWSTSISSGYFYSTMDIYTNDSYTNIFFKGVQKEEFIFPYIADNDEVLSNLDNIEDLLVFPGSLQKTYLPLKFGIYKYIDPVSDFEDVFEITLDTSSPYYLYIVENPNDYWWEIPTDLFKNLLVNGEEYRFTLFGANKDGDFSIPRSITYQGTTYIPPTDEELQTDAIKNQTQKIEEQTDAIKNQTEKIEEQTEVNKSIFARIGEILSYINPLSENFFAYKLIDLLVDALKSLFVPDERFSRKLF